MKFFKHFTDAHRGVSLQTLRRQHGFEAVGRYWTLVEICAEKMSKKEDEEYTEKHCVFMFDKTFIMQALGYQSHRHTVRYLSAIAQLGLCSFDEESTLIRCYMPKLLEYLDRDSKRARAKRGQSAPKRKRKNKIKINIESGDYETLFDIWNNHSGTLPKAEDFSEKRRAAAKERWTQRPDMDFWIKFAQTLASNDFCNGRTGGTWVADFDYFLTKKAYTKAIEGFYEKRAPKNQNSHLGLIEEPA